MFAGPTAVACPVVFYRNAVSHKIKIKINVKYSLHKRGTHDVIEIQPAKLLALEAIPGHVRLRFGEIDYRSHASPAIQCVYLVCVHTCIYGRDNSVCVYIQREVIVCAHTCIYTYNMLCVLHDMKTDMLCVV